MKTFELRQKTKAELQQVLKDLKDELMTLKVKKGNNMY
jgi:ribosomal protein L29